jgi:hypothetical protein
LPASSTSGRCCPKTRRPCWRKAPSPVPHDQTAGTQ